MVNNESISARKTFQFKIVSLILITVFILTILELSARRIMPKPFYSPRLDISEYPVWDFEGVTIWKFDEHFDEEQVSVFKANKRSFRIVGLGDSIMNGSGTSPDKTYMSLIGEKLRLAGANVDIIDLSMPGYNFIQEVSLYRSIIGDTKPDLVIIHSWEDDMSEYKVVGKKVFDLSNYSTDGFIHTIPLPDKVNQYLIMRSRLYQLLSFQIIRLKSRKPPRKGEKKVVDQFHSLIEQFDGDGSHILFMFSPRLDSGPVVSARNLNLNQEFYEIFEELAEKYHANILDLGTLIEGIDGAEIGFDRCHLNEKGHRILADKLVDYIYPIIEKSKFNNIKNDEEPYQENRD